MPESAVQKEKKNIRKYIKEIFQPFSRDQLDKKSLEIHKNLFTLDAWKNAEIILAYLPMKDEVNTVPLIEKALAMGKKVCLPRVEESALIFHYIDAEKIYSQKKQFILNPMGMLEPDAAIPAASKKEISGEKTLVLTPGLAFDSSCRRLGRGKSFYDRFLSLPGRKNTAAGIAFDFQIIDMVPSESHDMLLDYVITDKNVYSPQKEWIKK